MSDPRLSFLGAPVPPGFDLRLVSIVPGAEVPYEEAQWLDALVVVEEGAIELEGRCGSRRHFGCGDALWLAGLPLLVLRNPGPGPALLSVVSRRHRPAAHPPESDFSNRS